MAHAVHPNYPERHEPAHRPLPNRGPVIKVNANQRYATDAASQATFVRACDAAGVPWQVYSPPQQPRLRLDDRPDHRGAARHRGRRRGRPQLSMHSARELAGSDDAGYMVEAMTEVLRGA